MNKFYSTIFIFMNNSDLFSTTTDDFSVLVDHYNSILCSFIDFHAISVYDAVTPVTLRWRDNI